MVGYSGTSLSTKLGIREGVTLALVQAPPGLRLELPPGVIVKRQARGRADVVVAFFTRTAPLERRMDALGAMVFPAGALWIAWPKRTSGRETDLADHAVRALALPRGLVDNKVCAVDEVWTALRLVWRLENRLDEAAPRDPPPGEWSSRRRINRAGVRGRDETGRAHSHDPQ